MSEIRQTWAQVGEAFEALAARVRDHTGGSAAAGADELRSALVVLGDRFRDSMDSLSDAVNDPDVRAEAKRIGTAVGDAVVVTLSEVADEARDAIGRRGVADE